MAKIGKYNFGNQRIYLFIKWNSITLGGHVNSVKRLQEAGTGSKDCSGLVDTRGLGSGASWDLLG